MGTYSVRQQSSVNINAAPPGGGTAGRLLNSTYGASTNNTDINALQPFQGPVYSGLQAQVTRTSERHGSTGLIYTFSKAMNASDNSQANGLTFAYPRYWSRNWALAGYDREHNFQWWTCHTAIGGAANQPRRFLTTRHLQGRSSLENSLFYLGHDGCPACACN